MSRIALKSKVGEANVGRPNQAALEIIEKFSWTDIINIIFQNKSFLNIIISEFLKLKTNGKIKIEDINKCFEMSIVKKVKIKLKEV